MLGFYSFVYRRSIYRHDADNTLHVRVATKLLRKIRIQISIGKILFMILWLILVDTRKYVLDRGAFNMIEELSMFYDLTQYWWNILMNVWRSSLVQLLIWKVLMEHRCRAPDWICFWFDCYLCNLMIFTVDALFWCLWKWKMFMFGLSSNLQAWDQGYSWFRLLFAVDSVRSVDLKCLKG